MKMRIAWAVALAAGLACTAEAQDGGKIPWKGKSEDIKGVMAQAQKDGKALMMFFTSEG